MNKCEFCGKDMTEEEYNFCDICPDCREGFIGILPFFLYFVLKFQKVFLYLIYQTNKN